MSSSQPRFRVPTWNTLAYIGMTCALAGAGVAKTPMPVSPGAPRPGSVSEARCPTFSWAGVAEAGGYQIAVFRVAEQSEPELLTRISVPNDSRSFTLPVGDCLERGERYAWSVAATGNDGALAWAQPFLFEVEAAPSVEELEQTMATIRRHLEDGEVAALERPRQLEAFRGSDVAGAALGRDPSRETATANERDKRTRAARSVESSRDPMAAAGGPDSGGSLRTPSAATAPDPGVAASLAVSGHVRLGAASAIVKEDDLWLWDDALQNTGLGRHALAEVEGSGRKNTAVGWDALRNTTGGLGQFDGSFNTGFGYGALRTNTLGFDNTAVGFGALLLNEVGRTNTAVGAYALRNNTGSFNTAIGAEALSATQAGSNTATGYAALENNTIGSGNTAAGVAALRANTTGTDNVAVGNYSLDSNTDGFRNVAMGFSALGSNTVGYRNVAIGDNAVRVGTGHANTAVGYGALFNTTTGVANTALGYSAGAHNQTGSQNIFIRSVGNAANPAESNTIRIGEGYIHAHTYVAGIFGSAVSAATDTVVVIDSTGKLGTTLSSRRFKQDIQDLGPLADRLLDLRPVSFRYRAQAAGSDTPLQFGLIAEEVAEVFPELVVFDEAGAPMTVKYHLLSSLLLGELQEQHGLIEEQQRRAASLEHQNAAIRARLAALETRATRGPAR